LYRRDFRPSRYLQQPHVMLALNVVVSDSDDDAARLFTTQQQAFVNLRRGRPGLVPPPLESAQAFENYANAAECVGVDAALACAAVGSIATVRKKMQAFVQQHRPNELILTANVFDHVARIRSFELAMEAWR
ncbi:MAG: LLM class flavin-dependent oxidoreductase, partial [Dokdonella sp.]